MIRAPVGHHRTLFPGEAGFNNLSPLPTADSSTYKPPSHPPTQLYTHPPKHPHGAIRTAAPLVAVPTSKNIDCVGHSLPEPGQVLPSGQRHLQNTITNGAADGTSGNRTVAEKIQCFPRGGGEAAVARAVNWQWYKGCLWMPMYPAKSFREILDFVLKICKNSTA